METPHNAQSEHCRKSKLAVLKPADFDFELLLRKLQDHDEGPGWTASYCKRVCREYLRFLSLVRAYPDVMLVPSKAVDTFWHAHILDTQRYAADCMRVFGHFVHHFPYLGMRGRADEDSLRAASEHSLSLYARHFGAPPADIWLTAGKVPPGRGAASLAKCGAPAYAKCGAPAYAKCGDLRAL